MVLWLRGLIFTLVVPVVVSFVVPWRIYDGHHLAGGAWSSGWFVVAAGAVVYLACLLSFLQSGGTPAPFFTRRLRTAIGCEPSTVVRQGLYRYSRNPMYVGVVLIIFGQAILFRSKEVAMYGAFAWLIFHVVVVLVEEPHLRAMRGPSYEDYCRRVPRWIGSTKNS